LIVVPPTVVVWERYLDGAGVDATGTDPDPLLPAPMRYYHNGPATKEDADV
jgi:hypothetical protein